MQQDATDMIEILERIKLAANANSDAELARKIEISQQSIAKARTTKSVPFSWLPKVSTLFDVSLDWLYTGEGLMRLEQHPPKNDASLCEVNAFHSDVDIIMIPMAEARLSAGCGSLEVDAKSEKKYGFRSDFLFRKGSPKDMILMRVSGDSMAPEIEDNDVVLLDQSKKEITPGRLYAVGFEDAIYLKRIDKLPGKVVLKSTNPAYPPVELNINGDCEDLFRVIGRVLWCGREYK